MTDNYKAQISAFMDGELEAAAAGRLVQDRNIKPCLHRYQIISDVIQNRAPVPDLQLSQRISELIKNEPAIVAPTRRPLPVYVKPVAGIAVAASVATLAILGIQQYQADSAVQPSAPAIASVAGPVEVNPVAQPQGPVVRASAQPVLVVNSSSAMPVVQQPVIQAQVYQRNLDSVQMSRYILNHNEYQSNAGVHGVTPHVRLVATDGRK